MNNDGYFKPGDEVLFVRPCQTTNNAGYVPTGMAFTPHSFGGGVTYPASTHSTPQASPSIDLIRGKILSRYRNAELDAIYRIEHVVCYSTPSVAGMSIVYTVSYKDVYEEF